MHCKVDFFCRRKFWPKTWCNHDCCRHSRLLPFCRILECPIQLCITKVEIKQKMPSKKKRKKQIFLQGKQHSQPNVPHGGRHMWATFTSPTLMALSVRNWARNPELRRTTNYGGRSRAFYLHANCIPALQCRLAFVCDSISTCAHRLGKRVLVSDLMQKSRHIYLHVRALLWTRSPFCSTHMYEGEKN